MAPKTWKFMLFFFLAYCAAFVALSFLSIGGHMAHGDFYGSRQAPFSSTLIIIDWLLTILGLPLVSIFTSVAAWACVRLSVTHHIFLYIANGISLSWLATSVYLLFNCKKASGAPIA
jgi:hypothetical protein